MKAVVAAFNQEKALVGAFSVITNLRMQLFEALAEVRRSSSGITSSSFIHKLSPDYQSVYSKEEDEKRRSRDKDIYKSSSRV